MPSAEQLANQLLHSQSRGSVGAVDVEPRYIGAVDVQPRYVGSAPAQMTPGLQQKPVQYSPQAYKAGDLTYFGLGVTNVAAGAQVTLQFTPIKPFAPTHLRTPSTIQGLLLIQIDIGGINVWASSLGVPIELFSEVATQPPIDWPSIDPAVGIEFTVSNPTAGALNFTGALYGTALRR